MIKALVNTYLNVRTDSPEIRADNNPTFYKPGDEVEIRRTVVGQAYKGNPIWFELQDNNFIWSGGIAGTEFNVSGVTFERLPLAEQHAILVQAKTYYRDKFLSGQSAITGVLIGHKQRRKQQLPHYSLSFQVPKKMADVASGAIPDVLPFKGIAIPTDVVEDDLMQLSAFGNTRPGRPGCTISRLNEPTDWGSGAFFAHRTDNRIVNLYLVTNYHVAAFDLLLKNQFSFDVVQDRTIRKLVMPSWTASPNAANAFGYLYKGIFNQWMDIAIVRITKSAGISNLFDTAKQIDGYLNVVNDHRYIGTEVTMYGGFTGRVPNKKITSVNASQAGSIAGTRFTKDELIQVEKMSVPGDSGSPVFQGNKLVGIVVGSDINNTYLLSAEKIFTFFQLTLPS